MEQKFNALLELPVATINFGGIVGSRIEISDCGEVIVQIAYLESSRTARVRFFEKLIALDIQQYTKSLDLRLADINVDFGNANKTILSLDIICNGRKTTDKQD